MKTFIKCEMCDAEIQRDTLSLRLTQELSMERNTFFAVNAALKLLKRRRNNKTSLTTLATCVLYVD